MNSSTPPRTQPLPGRRFWLIWLGFCTLMLLVALQEVLFEGRSHWRWPLFDELTALAAATAVALWRWQVAPRLDGLISSPRHWFSQTLQPLCWLAPSFVLAIYGLRHAARALLGDSYQHAPWLVTLGYEGAKFALFYLLFAGVLFGQRSHRALAEQQLRAARAEQLSAEARLQQLTQQVQPHFLFNALNTIAGLLHEDPKAADRALMRLAALMRATTDATPEHRLADEWQLAQHYAGLMVQRFGPRVHLAWHDDPAAADCRVPALSLQPLLENCFVHGVERHRGEVHISVTARRSGTRLHLIVEDDVGDICSLGPTPADGVGLGNLRQRLAALHGTQATLTLLALAPRGVRAQIELPA